MKGVEAVAKAIIASSDRQYTVPGYPVTRLGELCGAEMVINEKTALEYALGDSLSGRRAAVIIKNVGVNACADPLLQATAQGLIGGVVLVVGDDPDATGSQTAQDSRYYGELAEIPVVEPDRETCFSGIEAALGASEQFSRVSMVRLTPPLLEENVVEKPVPRTNSRGRISDRSWTMNGRVTASENLYRKMFGWSTASTLNRWDGEPAGVGAAPGNTRIVSVHPPPAGLSGFTRINEYGRSYAVDHKGLHQVSLHKRPEARGDRGYYRTFCRECPFKLLMDLIKNTGMNVICDAGCSVLGMTPPYEFGIASYGMGASIAVAAKSTGTALTGDYALLHSGINALIDVYEKQIPLLCIVMKNDCAAMTGKQPAINPLPYLSWADPAICSTADEKRLKKELVVKDFPRTLIVTGTCPEGCAHETVEC